MLHKVVLENTECSLKTEHYCSSKEIALKLREILVGSHDMETCIVTVSIEEGLDEKGLQSYLDESIHWAKREVRKNPMPESFGFSGLFKRYFPLPSSDYSDRRSWSIRAINELNYLLELRDKWFK